MAAAADQSTPDGPIQLFFELLSPSDHVLSIDSLNALSLDQQLAILNVDNLSTVNSIEHVIATLYDDVPALKNSESDQKRFRSVLEMFYGEYVRIKNVSVCDWDHKQIAMSLYIFMMNRLQG